MKGFIAMLAGLLAFEGQALECGSFRLDQKGGSMFGIEAPLQPQYLCAPYVLAQMSDAWRLSHGKKPKGGREFRSSGLEAAIGYAAHTGKPFDGSTSIMKLYQFLYEHRPYFCDARLISKKGAGKDDEVFTKELLRYWRQYGTLVKAEGDRRQRTGEPLDLRVIFGGAAHRVATGLKCDLLQDSGLTTDEIRRLVRENRPMKYLEGILKPYCEKRWVDLPKPLFWERDYVSGEWASMADFIDSRFRMKNAQPVALNFCANVFEKPSYRGFEDERFAKDCKAHFAVVVGSRVSPKGGRCQLLVQDTAGTRCQKKRPWDCEKGKYWVDREDLLRNSSYIYYFGNADGTR